MATQRRARTIYHVKAIDVPGRIIRGTASTPEPDRLGDVIEPLGITFKNPVPLLLYHQPQKPVGFVTFSKPTKEGLEFEAELPTIEEPGLLRDRIEEAWQSIREKLVTGVSIGFRALEESFDKVTGGFRFLKTEVLELSLVTIPANAEATIHTIKSLELAASGRHSPGMSGTHDGKGGRMTTAEQITAFEATRTTKTARMAALMADAAKDNVTLDGTQTEEYDALAIDVANITKHIERLKEFERTQAAIATPITPVTSTSKAGELRGGTVPVISVKAMVPPATAFIRYCQAKAYGRGDSMRELAFAQQWRDSTPEVELCLKAAVAAGNTTDATWAGPLAQIQPLATAFLELLRPATYLGKIPGFFQVPFNTSVPSQTGGGTYQWVGQGAPKPVGKLQFGTITLGITKCAGIIVITEELARVSSPSAENVIRRDMINGIAQFLDAEFIDPTKAAVTNVSPGSVTNGVTPITSAGTTPANARTDIQALIAAMTAAGISTAGAALIMSESNAAALSAGLNPLGQPLFPALTSTGGTAMGITVYPSQTASSNVVLLQPDAILYADDGGVTIDVSREASLQMDSAPMNPADATVVMTSLWQSNYVGLRAERYINWKKARAGCVQYTVQTYA